MMKTIHPSVTILRNRVMGSLGIIWGAKVEAAVVGTNIITCRNNHDGSRCVRQ
jgi:hypothetical protein